MNLSQSAHIIPFPKRPVKHKGKRHFSQGFTFTQEEVIAFICKLSQNDTVGITQMLNEAKHFATLHGNYFCLPLLIAAKNNNCELITLLLEKGACAYTAIRDCRFKYLNSKMQSYLKSWIGFNQSILDSL